MTLLVKGESIVIAPGSAVNYNVVYSDLHSKLLLASKV